MYLFFLSSFPSYILSDLEHVPYDCRGDITLALFTGLAGLWPHNSPMIMHHEQKPSATINYSVPLYLFLSSAMFLPQNH